MDEEEAMRKERIKKKTVEIEPEHNFAANKNSEKNHSLNSFWRNYYYRIDQCMKLRSKKNETEILNAEVELLKQISFFKDQAIEIMKDYVNEKLVGWSPENTKFIDFSLYKGVWIKFGGKEINQ